MFCGKCGAQIPDNSVFCPSCGANLGSNNSQNNNNTPAQNQYNPTPYPNVNKGGTGAKLGANKNQIIGMAAIGLIALVILVLIFSLVGGRGYKKTAEKFVASVMEADAKSMLKLIPEKVKTGALEDMGYSKKDTKILAEELEDEFGYLSMMSELDDFSYKCKVTGAEKYKTKELRDIQNEYKEEYGVKVKDAKKVKVNLTVKYVGLEEDQELEIPVIKVGKSWYVDIENF